jgi:DNA-binding CsgD family transcriptional regulator
MKRTIILYGLALALFVSGLKFLEYRFFVRDLSIEFYTGIIVVIFTGLGIWIGLRLTWKKFVFVGGDFTLDAATLQKLDITKREHDVLELIAQGLSNEEIVDKLFVSLNTNKTHSSNLFLKLEVIRRNNTSKNR